jgi:hypothetical protein
MVEDGKISAEEGARLLAALNEAASPEKTALQARRRTLADGACYRHVTGKAKATVNLPLRLVDAGLVSLLICTRVLMSWL